MVTVYTVKSSMIRLKCVCPILFCRSLQRQLVFPIQRRSKLRAVHSDVFLQISGHVLRWETMRGICLAEQLGQREAVCHR